MLKFRNTKKYPGLTLVELIVSISIIALVTALFVVNYQVSTKSTDLIMTAQMVVADIYRAQNNAMGLVKYGAEVPAGGWGVHFNINEPTKYYIFADLEAPGNLGNMIFNPNLEGDNNQGAKAIDLPPNIEIAGLSNTSNGSVDTDIEFINIVFLPPDPRTNIYDSNLATSTEMTVYLKDVNNDVAAEYKAIQANVLGLAEVYEVDN